MLPEKNNRKQILLFFVLILSTSFYFLPSGYPQPGHILAAIFIVFALRHYRSIRLQTPEKLLLIFWLYATVVNFIFWWIHKDFSFIVSSVHWTFGLALFFALRQIYLEKPTLGAMLIWCLLVAMGLQVSMLMAGDQRFFTPDGRFTGFFNDPNQFSYWFLCMFVGSTLVATRPKWLNVYGSFVVLLGLFCVLVLASSSSAMLGTAVLLIGIFWWLGSIIYHRNPSLNGCNYLVGRATALNNLSLSALGRLCITILAGLLLLVGVFALLFYFNATVNDVVRFLVRRTLEQGVWNQLEVRGYTRLIDFPQHLLFGAGQGYDLRFREPIHGVVHEVHSSLAAPLFYYGVIGFTLLYSAFYLLARDRLSGWQWFVFAAPFVYGLTTYGLRTPVFWIMLASLYTITPKTIASRGSA